MFLLPAYASLWLAGRWNAARDRFSWATVAPLAVAAMTGATLCELFASGGLYLFSGRFAEPTSAEFGARLAKYFPRPLGSLAFCVAIAATVHGVFTLTRASAVVRESKAG